MLPGPEYSEDLHWPSEATGTVIKRQYLCHDGRSFVMYVAHQSLVAVGLSEVTVVRRGTDWRLLCAQRLARCTVQGRQLCKARMITRKTMRGVSRRWESLEAGRRYHTRQENARTLN